MEKAENNKSKLLVDSNVLVGVVREKDYWHMSSVDSYKRLKDKYEFWTINYVIQESATVVSMRDGMVMARKFLDRKDDLVDREIKVDNELEKASWEVFLRQKKKGTSFVDCALLAACQKYGCKGIVSFDKFYPKEILIT